MGPHRLPHRNVATVLVAPGVLPDLELHLATHDLWLWPVATAPGVVDGERRAVQVRRRLVVAARGAWDCAWGWVPVWVGFGGTWDDGLEPLPWAAHAALWSVMAGHADGVRYRKRLGGVPRSVLAVAQVDSPAGRVVE